MVVGKTKQSKTIGKISHVANYDWPKVTATSDGVFLIRSTLGEKREREKEREREREKT
jgi:hypothetical protein